MWPFKRGGIFSSLKEADNIGGPLCVCGGGGTTAHVVLLNIENKKQDFECKIKIKV